MKWNYTKDNEVINTGNGLVLTVLKGSYESAQVILTPPDGSLSQKWIFQHSKTEILKIAPWLTGLSYIKGIVNGFVVDANIDEKKNKPEEGKEVVEKRKNGFVSQQWVLSEEGFLQNFLGDLVLEMKAGETMKDPPVFFFYLKMILYLKHKCGKLMLRVICKIVFLIL